MTENEFYEKLKETIQEKMGDIPVELLKSVKNNNITHTSILIGQKDREVTPSIHLESMYQHYKNGWGMEQAAGFVIQAWQAYQNQKPDLPISEFLDWREAKEKIYFRLFSARCNPHYIREGICRDFLDMVLVAYYHAGDTDSGIMGIRITKELAEKQWHISGEEICRMAEINSPRLFPPQIKRLDSILLAYLERGLGKGIVPQDIREVLEQNPMYILQNEQRINGAAVMAYEGLLTRIYEKLGGGFYIIPSSIHELLLMPDTKRINEEMVRKTIFQINREHVEPEERLSDSLYHYDGQKLSIIGKEGGEDE